MDDWKLELVGLGGGLLAKVIELIIEAIEQKDPAKMRKVGDIIPAGPLQARLAFIAARMETEKEIQAALRRKG
jgi:hypothetical protein